MLAATYHAPLGDIDLVAGERGLVGLWFVDAPPRDADALYARAARLEVRDAESGGAACTPSDPADTASAAVLRHAWGWLNAYFAGQRPRWVPPVHIESSEFAHVVAAEVLGIPFAHVRAADRIACAVADRMRGEALRPSGRLEPLIVEALDSMPVQLIIPVHRVPRDSERPYAGKLRAFEKRTENSAR